MGLNRSKSVSADAWRVHSLTALSKIMTVGVFLLPPANEVCEGYAFTPVCHSVHRGGGSRPRPRGEVGGLARGVQVQTRGIGGGGGCPGPPPGGCPGPGPGLGCVSSPRPRGVYPSMHWGRHRPPQQMANATGSTHPTGMHSCSISHSFEFKYIGSAQTSKTDEKQLLVVTREFFKHCYPE